MSGLGFKSGREAGFTLLDVLIATAIMSILVMVAIPYYQDYRTRAKVAGEFGLIEPVKKRVTEEFMLTGNWPVDNDAAAVGAPEEYGGNYLEKVEVGDDPQPGALTLTFDSTKLPVLGENNVIVFYPQGSNGGAVSWQCDQGNMVNDFRPPRCRPSD